jgi:hypothetical protein
VQLVHRGIFGLTMRHLCQHKDFLKLLGQDWSKPTSLNSNWSDDLEHGPLNAEDQLLLHSLTSKMAEALDQSVVSSPSMPSLKRGVLLWDRMRKEVEDSASVAKDVITAFALDDDGKLMSPALLQEQQPIVVQLKGESVSISKYVKLRMQWSVLITTSPDI